MKAYRGSVGITPRILDLGTRWRCMASFTPRTLYPQGKNPLYPLDRRLGGPQSRSGSGDEDKKFPVPALFEATSILHLKFLIETNFAEN